MKGIILAGGKGTRLHPLTKVVSKQLLPVYDKPMIFYPLTTLLAAGVDDFLIITNPEHHVSFRNLLGDGESFGVKITYISQKSPRGLAEAPILGEEFLNGEPFVLILGDNLLHGPGLGRALHNFFSKSGATIFLYPVQNPQDYGVVRVGKNGEPLEIVEKPKKFVSNLAIPGLYFFDSQCVNYCKQLEPSARGELEITEVLSKYLEEGVLRTKLLGIGTAWLDMGNFDALLAAGQYVAMLQARQGIRLGDPFSISEFKRQIN